MAKRVEVKTDLTAETLYERYRKAKDPVERTHWHMLWQVKEGKSPRKVAELLGYTAGWVRRMIRRWNAAGEAGITDHRRKLPGATPLLTAEQQCELAEALQQPPADGGLWSGAIRGGLDAGETGTRDRPTTRLGLFTAARV